MIIRRPEDNLLEKNYTNADWTGDINYIDITPSIMYFDDLDTNVQGGNLWNAVPVMDFSPTFNGSVWFSFGFPEKWDTDKDIFFNYYYVLDGLQTRRYIKLEHNIWVVSPTKSIDLNTPHITTSINIDASADNSGKYTRYLATTPVIESSKLLSKQALIITKLTRKSEEDNYSGIFKLVRVVAKQMGGNQ